MSAPREYHYVIALQWAANGKNATIGRDGVITLHPWATRTEVIAHLRQLTGIPDGFTEPGLIIHFSLAPEIAGDGDGDQPDGTLAAPAGA